MLVRSSCCLLFFFFFNDTATTEIYTLSLHDALPIYDIVPRQPGQQGHRLRLHRRTRSEEHTSELQSRVDISYAVFCLKQTSELQSRVDISYAVFCLEKKTAHQSR